MWPNQQFPADLVTFTEEILTGKFLILFSDNFQMIQNTLIIDAYLCPKNILCKFSGKKVWIFGCRFISIIIIIIMLYRSSHQKCSMKKVFLKISQNLQENTYAKVSGLSLKKGTLAQVFPYQFCEIFIDTFFTEHLWATNSGYNAISCRFSGV